MKPNLLFKIVSIAVAQNGHSSTLTGSEAEPQMIGTGTKRPLMH
jgi:hypothetical protein